MGLVSTYLSLAGNSSWLWIAALLLVLYYIYMRGFIAFFDSTTHRTDEKTFLITGAETGKLTWILELTKYTHRLLLGNAVINYLLMVVSLLISKNITNVYGTGICFVMINLLV